MTIKYEEKWNQEPCWCCDNIIFSFIAHFHFLILSIHICLVLSVMYCFILLRSCDMMSQKHLVPIKGPGFHHIPSHSTWFYFFLYSVIQLHLFGHFLAVYIGSCIAFYTPELIWSDTSHSIFFIFELRSTKGSWYCLSCWLLLTLDHSISFSSKLLSIALVLIAL